MSFKKLLLNWQVILLILVLIISVVAISPRPDQKGLIITSVGDGPFYGNIESGTIIYSASILGGSGATELSSLSDLLAFQDKAGYLTLQTNKGVKNLVLNGSEVFNVSADKVPNSNLKFGLDIQGGTRALLKPENVTNTTIDDTISTLQTRIDVYGLRQTEFRKVDMSGEQYIIVSVAGGTPQEIESLLTRKGDFMATIPLTLDEGSTFNLGKFVNGQNNAYTVETVINSSVRISGKTYNLGDRFTLEGINFKLTNITGKVAVIEGLVFTSKDIVNVGIPPEASILQKSGSGYSYQFGVSIAPVGAKRFAELTQNLNTLPSSSGKGTLSEKIHLYLDQKEFDALSISADLRGKEVTNPVVTGYGNTRDETVKSRDTLKAVLKSGDLPTKVEIVSVDQLNSTLGESYLYIIALAGLAAIALVSTVIFIRYRKIMISIGVIATMLFEVVIILGFAALTQWNLSALALAGLIAAIGFGVDNQIFIVDETVKGTEKYGVREGIKRAYFMILGSGASTICAMIPILVLGFGIFKEIGGFALTTIVGVLVGILITRPAFSKYVEWLSDRK